MRFPVSNLIKAVSALAGVLLIFACKLSKDEEARTTLSFTALYDSLKQYDSVVITLKDPQDGHTLDVAFAGKVRVPGDLEKRETPHWDGGKVKVAIEAYDAAGKLVYRLESSFDGRSNRRDSTYIFMRPGMGLSYPSDRLILVAGDSLPYPPVTIAPADLADKRILWSSSAPDVVGIGRSSLRAVKRGNAQVTARMAADTSKFLVFRATVYERMELPEQLSLSADTLHLIAQGAPDRLNVSVIPSGAGKDAEWSVDRSSIASVTEDGIVQGLKAGAAWVRVRSLLRPALADSAVVMVSDPVPPERVVFSGEATELYVGGASESLMVSVLPPRASQQVEFLVSPGTVVREEKGRIRGVSAGEAQVIARSGENGSLADTLKVWVLPAQRVESVTLGRKNLLLYTGGEDIVLTAAVEPSGLDQKVQWRSGNPAIAKVDGTGRVTGTSPGRARIYGISRADSARMDSAEAVVRTDAPRLSVGRADTSVAVGSEVAIVPIVAPQEYGVVTAFKWDADGRPGWDDSSASLKAITVKCDQEKVYDFRFYVRDTEGNETLVGKKVTSVTGPVVNILSPRNGASVNTPELKISWTLDGVEQTTGTDTVLKEGANAITRSARDGAGKVFSTTVTVYLDTTPPAKPRVRGGGGTASAFPTWTWTPGGGGSGAYRAALDSETFATGEIEDTVFVPTSALVDGVHRLYVQERDAAGNWSPSGQAAFNVDATGPAEPAVRIGVASPTNQRRPVWTWSSGGRGGSGLFQSRFGNGSFPTGASPDTAFTPPADLPEGNHVLYVRERDSLGNWSAPGSASVTVDTTPPAAPKVYGTSPTNLAPRWSWTSGGGAGIFRYKVDGPPAGSPETGDTAYTLAAPVSKTTYTLSVQERDAAGNWSPPASLAIAYDLSKPMVAFTAPQASGLYLTRSATVDLAGTVGSPQGSATAIRSVAYAVDGVAGTRTLESDGAKWSLKALPLVNNKTLTVTVTALDGAGNSGEASLEILMDTTAPAAPVFTDQPPAVVNKTDSRTGLQWVWGRTGAATDSFVVKLNGKEVARQAEAGYSVNGFADGNYRLEVAEKDMAGNLSVFTAAQTVLVDRVAPNAPEIAQPPTPRKTAQWTWTGGGGGNGVFKCTLDGGVEFTCSSPYELSIPTDGDHFLKVREQDGAGNVSLYSSAIVTIDLVRPSIVQGNLISISTRIFNSIPTFFGTASDERALKAVQYKVGTGDYLPAGSSNWNFKPALPTGTQVVTIRAEDQAGNWDSIQISVTYRPNVIFVRKGASGSGDGSSWSDAVPELNKILRPDQMFTAGTEFWVSEGTYDPPNGEPFVLRPSTSVYGGFAAEGTDVDTASRNLTNNISILRASEDAYDIVTNSFQKLDGSMVYFDSVFLSDFRLTYENRNTNGHLLAIGNATRATVKSLYAKQESVYVGFMIYNSRVEIADTKLDLLSTIEGAIRTSGTSVVRMTASQISYSSGVAGSGGIQIDTGELCATSGSSISNNSPAEVKISSGTMRVESMSSIGPNGSNVPIATISSCPSPF